MLFHPRPRPPPGDDSLLWLQAPLHAASSGRGGLGPGEAEERRRLVALLLQPPSSGALGADARLLLWRYRLLLQAEARALGRFLRVVDWDLPGEAEHALGLMTGWAPAPEEGVDVPQALELLTPAISQPRVRAWAVEKLGGLADVELQVRGRKGAPSPSCWQERKGCLLNLM